MSCHLNHSQDCLNGPGCNPAFPKRPRPARHGGLCSACYLAADPAIKATADLLDRLDSQAVLDTLRAVAGTLDASANCPEIKLGNEAAKTASEVRELEDLFQRTSEWDSLEVAQACALEAMYDAPAWGEAA